MKLSFAQGYELHLQGLKLVSAAMPGRETAPKDPWRLDAIGSLDGR
jgi:hypothetical protein